MSLFDQHNKLLLNETIAKCCLDAACKAGARGRGEDGGSVTGLNLVWSDLLWSDVVLWVLQVCGKNRDSAQSVRTQ